MNDSHPEIGRDSSLENPYSVLLECESAGHDHTDEYFRFLMGWTADKKFRVLEASQRVQRTYEKTARLLRQIERGKSSDLAECDRLIAKARRQQAEAEFLVESMKRVPSCGKVLQKFGRQ